jgi:aspartyl-tRNA(Asn)/glutamyl-tRNA(Gln) amidotransferase subunit C
MAATKITLEQAARVAQLARLSPSEAQLTALCADLSAIVSYVALLDEVDTSAVEPTAHAVVDAAPFRPDVVQPSLDRDEALSQAPASRAQGFSVPKVLEVES